VERHVSFVIRATSNEQGQQIRGQIEHVPTGTTGHFRNLAQAEAFIRSFLRPLPVPGGPPPIPSPGETVSSVFSFLRSRAETPAGELAAAPGVEGEQPAAGAEAGVFTAEAGLTPPISLRPYVNELLDLLRPYLPPSAPGLPPNTLSLVQLSHRSLGLGGRRGLYTRGGVDVAELRGGWLDAVVRFDLWGPDLGFVNTQAADLQAALLTDNPTLRHQGLLQLSLTSSTDGPPGAPPSSWRKTLDYAVLYEYHFQDTDGAASLIARVPIDSQTDLGATSQETTEIRNWMVRWDNEGAPALEVTAPPRGVVHVRGLSIAAYLPGGGPAGMVTQTVVRDGGTATTAFGSLTAFLADFQLDSSPLSLVFPPLPLAPGEVQEIHDFQVGERRFDPPIVLKGGGDLFRISFSETAFPADNPSQVYLRALVS
jgi:hypothetical protein